jgi:hypothetical protein
MPTPKLNLAEMIGFAKDYQDLGRAVQQPDRGAPRARRLLRVLQ